MMARRKRRLKTLKDIMEQDMVVTKDEKGVVTIRWVGQPKKT